MRARRQGHLHRGGAVGGRALRTKALQGLLGMLVSSAIVLATVSLLAVATPSFAQYSPFWPSEKFIPAMRRALGSIAGAWLIGLSLYWLTSAAFARTPYIGITIANWLLGIAFLTTLAVWLDASFRIFNSMIAFCNVTHSSDAFISALHKKYFPSACFRGMMAYRLLDVMILLLPLLSLFIRIRISRRTEI